MSEKTAIGIVIGFFLTRFLSEKGATIGAIYPEVPEIFECNDGTFSTSSGKNACARHGGRKSRQPLSAGSSGSGLLNIQDIPLSQIHIDRQLFQGREKAFSQRSVDNIVNDVTNGRFAWENLDPITLWRSPDGKLYLLSGHSRLRAFEVLAEMRATANGKGFDRIPAKIRSGPLDEARRLALESNTLSTKETDVERAAYYRKLRQDGRPEKELLAQIRKNEGRNAANIYAYTFLSPTGKTWATLRQFAESEDTSANIAKSMAKWIGAARREYPMLTNDHERELHDWLFEHRGYGSGAGQVSKESDFQERVGRFISRNTEFGVFAQDKPLNILNSLLKSPAEQEYDRQIDDLQLKIRELDNQIKLKTKTLTSQKATPSDLQRILTPLEATLRNLRADLQRMILQKQNVIEYGKREATLFGHIKRVNRNVFGIGKIYTSAPPGVSPCADGKFSDKNGRGACSYHGGILTEYKKKRTKNTLKVDVPELQIQKGFFIRDTLVSPTVFNRLPDENKREILRLYEEFRSIPYIDVRTQIGPNQSARMTKTQKDEIQRNQLKVFRIEEQIQELLKEPAQVEAERRQQEQEQAKRAEQRLLTEKEWYERLYSHHLKSNRENQYKKRYREILQQLNIM